MRKRNSRRGEYAVASSSELEVVKLAGDPLEDISTLKLSDPLLHLEFNLSLPPRENTITYPCQTN